MRRSDHYRFVVIVIALVIMQFSVRTKLGDERMAPDFLLAALLIYTIRAQPGKSAGAGFVVGLLRDALNWRAAWAIFAAIALACAAVLMFRFLEGPRQG